MSSYINLVDDLHEWLRAVISDAVDELNRVGFLYSGYIYAPYIPLQTSLNALNVTYYPHMPVVSSAVAYPTTLSATYTAPVINHQYYGTMSISSDGTCYPASCQPTRRVATFDGVLSAVRNFIAVKPDEVAPSYTCVAETLQTKLVKQTLVALTKDGVLRYDSEQKGWWRPEVLDAMAALTEESSFVEDDLRVRAPCESETPSP